MATTKTVHIGIDPKDYKVLKEYSEELGLSPTHYIKAITTQDIDRIKNLRAQIPGKLPRLTLNYQ
jgi:hypothetical protein